MKLIYKLIIITTAILASNTMLLAQTNISVSTATVISSFPHTETNVNSNNGGSASGMVGSCYTLPCCSVLVYKVILPTAGSLSIRNQNFSPLGGSIIAYTPNTNTPTTWSDLTYYSAVGNFCGFRDSLQLGRGYNWPHYPAPGNNGQYTDPSLAIPAGEYYVLLWANNQQASIGPGLASFIFEFAPAPALSITSQTNTSCNSWNGSLTATMNGGTANYSYTWSNGSSTFNTSATTNTITGLSAGTYTVTVTDGLGATSTTSGTVSQTASPVASATVTTAISCNGFTNGQVTGSATGGTSPFTYSWNTGNLSATETSLGAGTYSVTITDQNGCTDSASVVVSEPAALVASSSVTSALDCHDDYDGQVTGSASGGTSPYTYQWNTGATAALETGLSAGTYSLTITDQNACTDSTTVTMSEPNDLVASAVTNQNASSIGATDGQITGSATGGTSPFTYQWNTGGTSALETGLGAGTYSITITDQNACTDNASTTVTQPPPFSGSAAVNNTISCNGLADGGATATPVGGTTPYTYAWSNGATTNTITGVVAGTYTVTMSDAGSISATSSVTITQPTALVASSSITSTLACNADSDGQITGSATGGTTAYTYSWNTGGTSALETGLSAGTYTLTITDQNGCTNNTSVVMTEPTALVVTAVTDNNTTYFGATDGQVTGSATGGTTAYTYAWSSGATTATASGISAGTYTITITDQNACTGTAATSVTQPPVFSGSTALDSNVTCNGLANGGATASPVGGVTPYTYTWSNGATTSSITGIVAGTYTVTMSDASSISATSSVTITEPTTLVSTSVIDSNITCNGLANGGATSSATGGTSPYTYAWSNAATTASITGVMANSYTVTVTDANNCANSTVVSITEPMVLNAAIVVDSNVNCFGQANGGATASGTGGTTPFAYVWDNTATTATITGVIADTFMVTITDVNNCTDTASVMITEPPMMVLSLRNDTAVCLNEVLVLDAGTGYSSYAWSDNAITQTTTANTSASGTTDYSVIVTNINGCEATDTVNVTVNNPTSLSIDPIANLCAYGTDSLMATTGFDDYLWSTSDTTNNIFVDGKVLGQGSFSYSLTATDSNGCIANASTSFDVYNQVTIDLGADVSIKWIDGVAESYSVDAGAGYASYSWNNGNGTNQTYLVTLLNMGNVYLDVTDATGCIGKDTIYVDFILGTSTPTIEIGQVKMYPNPAFDVLNIEIANFVGQNQLDIKILSITGAVMLNKSFEVNGSSIKQSIDVSAYTPGTYFVAFNSNGQKIIKSFIIR